MRGVRMHEHEYDDPFVTADLARVERRSAELAELAVAHFGGRGRDLSRKRVTGVDRTSNPASRRLMELVPGVDAWMDLIPRASALEPLYDPTLPILPNGRRVTGELSVWLRNCADARAIRSRGEIVRTLLTRSAAGMDRTPRWLSLACGAAQPVIAALTDLRDGPLPEALLVDIDPGALRRARSAARAAGAGSAVETRRADILEPGGISLARRPRAAPSSGYDVVEAVGIVEYLQVEDWPYRYGRLVRTRRRMAGARTFLRNAYDLVAPGGSLVIGNMLDTHPALGFTLDVVEWPHIRPRSARRVVEIIREAGIEETVDVHLPDDGAYAVYRIERGG